MLEPSLTFDEIVTVAPPVGFVDGPVNRQWQVLIRYRHISTTTLVCLLRSGPGTLPERFGIR